jgi:hypothetical protein
MMIAELNMYPSKIEELSPDEAYYALMDETYRTDDGGYGYNSSPYIDIIYLGNREQTLGWLHQQEKLREQPCHTQKGFKIVIMKPCTINRTVTFDL